MTGREGPPGPGAEAGRRAILTAHDRRRRRWESSDDSFPRCHSQVSGLVDRTSALTPAVWDGLQKTKEGLPWA